MARSSKWIAHALGKRKGQKYGRHRGALRHTLGVREGETIPVARLHEAAAHPETFVKGHKAQLRLVRQANLALTFRKLPRHHGPR